MWDSIVILTVCLGGFMIVLGLFGYFMDVTSRDSSSDDYEDEVEMVKPGELPQWEKDLLDEIWPLQDEKKKTEKVYDWNKECYDDFR